MTYEEIENMAAGRELDALIAERLFGWEQRVDESDGSFHVHVPSGDPAFPCSLGWWSGGQPRLGDRQPAYSTDIAAAFAAVGMMRKKGYWLYLQDNTTEGESWRAEFLGHRKAEKAWGGTAPLTICRAALVALLP